MAFLKIDGVDIPTPDSCTLTEYDLDSAQSGRPESGVMFRERVRAKIISRGRTFHPRRQRSSGQPCCR